MIVKKFEKNENNISAQFQVETSAAEFEAAVQGAYLKAKGSIYIPGFRKGKAPRAIVEGMYGAEVFYQDAMEELAPQAFEYGVENVESKFVGQPALIDMQITEERTGSFTFEADLYPTVTLGQYKGLEAVREQAVVSEEAIDAEIEGARRRNARMISVEREAQMGDTANIDFDGYLNGERFDGGKAEGYDLELGSNSFVPGFEEQIVGMQIGEEKDLDITFPENYVQDLAGKAVVFKVKLNSLNYPELPELDDEFAKDVSEFDTLEEYKADLRAKQQKQAEEQAENKFRTDIMKQAIDNMQVVIPESMIDGKVEEVIRNYAANFGMNSRDIELDQLKQMLGIDEATLNENIRPSAENQVKSDLLIDAIVEAENIEVTDEEAEEYLQKVAESIKAKADDVREYFGADFIKSEKKKDKAAAIIFDSAVEKKPKAKRTRAKAKKAEAEAEAEVKAETEEKAE